MEKPLKETPSPDKKEWFTKLKSPMYQAFGGFSIFLLFLLFGLISKSSVGTLSDTWGYQSGATGMLLFGVGNALMSLGTKDVNKYWSKSFVCFIVMVAAIVGVAWLYTGLWITEAGSYKLIFLVLAIGYMVLLSIMSMIRGIVNFAETEEWSAPRKKNR